MLWKSCSGPCVYLTWSMNVNLIFCISDWKNQPPVGYSLSCAYSGAWQSGINLLSLALWWRDMPWRKRERERFNFGFLQSVAYQTYILKCLAHIIDLRPYWTVLELGNGRKGETSVAVFSFFFIVKAILDLKIPLSKRKLSEKTMLYQIKWNNSM